MSQPPAHQDGSPPSVAGCDGLNVCNLDAHCSARVGFSPRKNGKEPRCGHAGALIPTGCAGDLRRYRMILRWR